MDDRQAAGTGLNEHNQPEPLSVLSRIRVGLGLLAGLRKPDFQAARAFIKVRYAGGLFPWNWCRFLGWSLRQMFVVVPEAAGCLSIAGDVSRTPMWLLDENPLANHPWNDTPDAQLPAEVDTVVIGAGFTGAALAYHWSRTAPPERNMIVLEMDDPASGSSGRNEGLVVMGRYFKMVHDTVFANLTCVRTDLLPADQSQLAEQFADRYCRAAYRNAEMIDRTIREKSFDCDYVRAGWVQAREADGQTGLDESVTMAIESGWTDWKAITPKEVAVRSGMRVEHNAGFSVAAASWHPAKWVWCLLQAAIARSNVALFTQTKVTNVEDDKQGYLIRTSRGSLRARHVVYATESYTPVLQPQFHDAILPVQEQAASGEGGPEGMRRHVGISGSWFFAGRYGSRVLFGSGGARLRDNEAGVNRPSRFLTRFVAAELKRHFGPYRLNMTNEWSGTVGYTPDEYPIVGCLDGKGRYIIAGMCGSGSGVSFNGGRCVVNRILGQTDESDDYPEAYFSPGRLLDPANHRWPVIERNSSSS